MPVSENTKLVATGVIAAAVTGTVVFLLMTAKAHDDDPIIMAGGSLHFLTSGKKFAKQGKAASHINKRYVSSLDVTSGNPPTSTSLNINGGPLHIVVRYCLNNTCENVYLDTGQDNQGLTLSDDNGTIGDEANTGGALITHQPDAGKITQMTVNGTPYTCNNGECFYAVHYCSKKDCS